MKSLLKYLYLSLFLIFISILFGKTDVYAMENTKCKVIIGDSRTLGVILTLNESEDYINIYDDFDGFKYNAVYLKDDILYLLCSYPGGYYKNGAYDNTARKALEILRELDILKNCSSYSFINMFAFNDCFLDYESCKRAPSEYLKKDAYYASQIRGCKSVYQFNAGPVDETGEVLYNYFFSNALVADYNMGFVSTKNVSVVDLYDYLLNSGYKSTSQDIGIHYDAKTNQAIIDLLTVLQ